MKWKGSFDTNEEVGSMPRIGWCTCPQSQRAFLGFGEVAFRKGVAWVLQGPPGRKTTGNGEVSGGQLLQWLGSSRSLWGGVTEDFPEGRCSDLPECGLELPFTREGRTGERKFRVRLEKQFPFSPWDFWPEEVRAPRFCSGWVGPDSQSLKEVSRLSFLVSLHKT